MVCGRKLFSENKRLYNRLRVLLYDFWGDRCRCYLWRVQEACRRAQTYLIVYFYLKFPLIISYTQFPVSVCRASTVLLVQCTCNFGEKFRFTEVVLFQNFLLTRITTSRAYYHNKKGQCRVKKSKTTLLLEIWSLHQRRAC